MNEQRVVSVSREVHADPQVIFDLIADPAQHPRWDGNNNTQEAQDSERITAVGQVFVMLNTSGNMRDSQIVEFEEGRLIAWKTGPVGEPRPGHIWKWQVEPKDEGALVTHTYDWTALTDEKRIERAQSYTPEALQRSVDRLAELAESQA